MEAERQELALMRERAAEAAMRRLHDTIVINDDDDVLSVGDAEREVEQAEALDCASVEESRRAEDELEHYLLNDNDDEHVEVEARATNRGPRRMMRAMHLAAPCYPRRKLLARCRWRTYPRYSKRAKSHRGHNEFGRTRMRIGIQTQRWTSPRRERSSAPCRWSRVGVMRRRA